jgi:hypothetical protein
MLEREKERISPSCTGPSGIKQNKCLGELATWSWWGAVGKVVALVVVRLWEGRPSGKGKCQSGVMCKSSKAWLPFPGAWLWMKGKIVQSSHYLLPQESRTGKGKELLVQVQTIQCLLFLGSTDTPTWAPIKALSISQVGDVRQPEQELPAGKWWHMPIMGSCKNK